MSTLGFWFSSVLDWLGGYRRTRRFAVRRLRFFQAELAAARRSRRRAGASWDSRPSWWNEPTHVYPQVGRAGWLTLAQAWRANGGRWPEECASRGDDFSWFPRPPRPHNTPHSKIPAAEHALLTWSG
jgi:hypothetical protein